MPSFAYMAKKDGGECSSMRRRAGEAIHDPTYPELVPMSVARIREARSAEEFMGLSLVGADTR
jgi:hypothetical protein